jgi:uncharacterized damage-inducible protein DinB
MTAEASWRAIVASALDWDQAHATFEQAVADFPPALRGRRPEHFVHSAWELVEHIRMVQFELLDFMQRADYDELDAFWPASPEPPNDRAWDATLSRIIADRAALKDFATSADVDLTTRIPHGTGQTYLRTVIVAIDHMSYHVGQLIAVRRLLGAWTAS